jgi:hypothetical protein
MIIEDKSVEKFGDVPKFVLDLAEKADYHGSLFSQDLYSLFVYYNEDSREVLSGWMLVDNYSRKIYDSILIVNNERVFAVSCKDKSVYSYKRYDDVFIHANNFFMMGITDNLVSRESQQPDLKQSI